MGKVLDAHDAVSTELKLSVAPHDPQATELHMRGRFAYQRAWFGRTRDRVAPRMACMLARSTQASPRRSHSRSLAPTAQAEAESRPRSARAISPSVRSQSSPQLADAPRRDRGAPTYDGGESPPRASFVVRSSTDAIGALDWMGRLLIGSGDTERELAYLDRVYGLDPAMIVSRLHRPLGRARSSVIGIV